jgi:hypothetical protein
MPSPMVVAAMIQAGAQLLGGKKQSPQFQMPTFGGGMRGTDFLQGQEEEESTLKKLARTPLAQNLVYQAFTGGGPNMALPIPRVQQVIPEPLRLR